MSAAFSEQTVNGRKELLMLIFVLFAGVNLMINLIRPVPGERVMNNFSRRAA